MVVIVAAVVYFLVFLCKIWTDQMWVLLYELKSLCGTYINLRVASLLCDKLTLALCLGMELLYEFRVEQVWCNFSLECRTRCLYREVHEQCLFYL